MPRTSCLLFVAVTATSLSAQVTMTHLAEIDVANAVSGIGNNVAAVAWNGADLYVAGYNGSTAVGPVALNKLTGALSPAPVWGVPFGLQATAPSQRGYVNLDIDPQTGRIVAGYDAGAIDPQGITCWDANGVLVWAKSGRGSSGVAFDPGFPGGNPQLGSGTGWAGFGQPGRALQDALGADVWTLATGMGIQVAGQGTFFRDLDFDPRTGDVYLRSSNNVFRGVRTGDNSCVVSLLVDTAEANTINLQNVCFVDSAGGEVILWNDRGFGGPGQAWASVMKAVRKDGSADTIDWGTFAPATSAGAYDFSFDRATNTIAISDYFNRKVHVFAVQVNPTYPYGQGCAGQGAVVPALVGSGQMTSAAGGTITYTISGVAPLSVAFFAFGFGTTQIPLGGGCDILIDPVTNFYLGPVITGPGAPGSGSGTGQLSLPPGFTGFAITTQGVVLEGGNPQALVLSNGVLLALQ